MGADKVLVDSFKELYASQGANYAEALSEPIISAAAEIAERQERIRNKIDEHISLFPPEADVTYVPTIFVSDVLRPRLMNLRNEYSQYSEGFVRARSSEDKSKFKSLMDQTMNKVNALNSDIQNYKSLKSEGFFDYDNNLISKQAYEGKQGDKTDEIFNVFTGETELTIDEKTNKIGFFSNQENRFIPINEFQKFLPPQKAEKQATLFNSLLDSAGKGEISEQEINVAKNTLLASIETGNTIQILKSLALDSLQIPGMSLLDTEADETELLISQLDSEDKNVRIIAEKYLKDSVINSFEGMLEDRVNMFNTKQAVLVEQETKARIEAQGKLDRQKLKIVEQEEKRRETEEEILTEKEVTNLLINDNPDYKDPVMDTIVLGPDKGKKIQKEIDGVKQFETVDVTKEEGFNRNEARLLEIAQRINKTYAVERLEDDKVYIGPRVTNNITGKTNIDVKAGPFTTMKAIKDWYLRTVKDKDK